jgi:hypothetical protein
LGPFGAVWHRRRIQRCHRSASQGTPRGLAAKILQRKDRNANVRNANKSKTWLSGINTNTIGGFYEFDSLENAKAYATGYLAAAANQIGGSLSVKLFNGDVTADANRGMSSPFYARVEDAVLA